MNKITPIIVLGLDGACWSILNRFMDRGIMPNLSSLYSESNHSTLISVIPPYSAPAWACFMTGNNPGKTGVFSLTKKLFSGEMLPVTSSEMKSLPFWNYAGEVGITCSVVNVPLTFPPTPLKGVMITGLFTPAESTGFVYPSSMGKKVLEKFPGYHPAPFSKIEKSPKFIEEMIRFTENSLELETWIASTINPGLRIQVLQTTDIIQHFFMEYIDPEPHFKPDTKIIDSLNKFYYTVDQVIGEKIRAVGETGVLILVSDHGFSKLKKVFHLNRWLENQGFLERQQQGWLRKSFQRSRITRKNLVAIARKLDIFNLLGKLNLEKQWELGKKLDNLLSGNINWKKTTAFCGEMSEEAIYLNRQDRFQNGIPFNEKDIKNILDQLVTALESQLMPGGRYPVLKNFHLKTQVYSGNEMKLAPEIILEPVPDTLIDAKFSAAGMLENTDPGAATGRHDREGILLMNGPMFQANKKVSQASIMDIAPTILYLLGIGVPETMDGKLLVDWFKNEYIKTHPINTVPGKTQPQSSTTLDDNETKQIIDRLKTLGYL